MEILVFFFLGIWFYKSGKARLTENFDVDINLIPDKDVKTLIRSLDVFNIKTGNIYIFLVAPFLIFLSIIFLFFTMAEWEILDFLPKDNNTLSFKIISTYIFFNLFLLLSVQVVSEEGYITKSFAFMDYNLYKNNIYYLYKAINFKSVHKKNAINYEHRSIRRYLLFTIFFSRRIFFLIVSWYFVWIFLILNWIFKIILINI